MTKLSMGLAILIQIIIWLWLPWNRPAVETAETKAPSAVSAAIADPGYPPEVVALEKELGLKVIFEQGREAYILYGHEYSIYGRGTFGYAWSDSLDGVIQRTRIAFREWQDKPNRDELEITRRANEARARAERWDHSH